MQFIVQPSQKTKHQHLQKIQSAIDPSTRASRVSSLGSLIANRRQRSPPSMIHAYPRSTASVPKVGGTHGTRGEMLRHVKLKLGRRAAVPVSRRLQRLLLPPFPRRDGDAHPVGIVLGAGVRRRARDGVALGAGRAWLGRRQGGEEAARFAVGRVFVHGRSADTYSLLFSISTGPGKRARVKHTPPGNVFVIHLALRSKCISKTATRDANIAYRLCYRPSLARLVGCRLEGLREWSWIRC